MVRRTRQNVTIYIHWQPCLLKLSISATFTVCQYNFCCHHVIKLQKKGHIRGRQKPGGGGVVGNKMRPYGILRIMQNKRQVKQSLVHENEDWNSPHIVLPGIYYEREYGTSATNCESRIIHCQLRNCRKWARDVLRSNTGTKDTSNEKRGKQPFICASKTDTHTNTFKEL
jgi:hypothetical protein